MKTIQELRDDLSHKVRTLDDLRTKVEKENRSMTPEEASDTNALFKDIEDIKKDIATIEEHETRMQKIASVVNDLKKVEPRKSVAEQPGQGANPHVEVQSYGTRYGKMKAFKDERAAYISGQWFRAMFYNDYRAQRWCQENGVATRAHSEGVNSAGGALVPDQLSQAIIDLREVYGVFRRECDVVPMGSDTMTIPRRTGGLTAYFTSEGVSMTDSQGSWNQVGLTAKKLAVLTYLSTELAEDAIINLADTLASEIAYALALKEDQCGFIGDGTGTYGGITGITVKAMQAGFAGSKVTAAAGHDLFTEIDAGDIALLMSKVPQYARAGAKFYCSQVAMDLVFGRLQTGAGGNTIQTVAGGYTPRHLGHDIVVSQVLPAGSATDYTDQWMLGFGNLKQAATLGERRGLTIKRSDEIKFVEDQIALKGTSRVDINVHDLGDTTNAGPFVSLVGGT